MTFIETSGDSSQVISRITSAESPEAVLDLLDKLNIEWHVSDQGDLIVKYWQIVAEGFIPPEKIGVFKQRVTNCSQVNELEWLSRHIELLKTDYSGKWIAICENRVVASASSIPELMVLTKDYEKPFITQIPAESVTWKFTYVHQKL